MRLHVRADGSQPLTVVMPVDHNAFLESGNTRLYMKTVLLGKERASQFCENDLELSR